jgi:hypothetical protein
VPKPEGFDVIAWYDLSPMRPDEYAETNAWRWHEALVLRNAYQMGVDDAKHEKTTRDKLIAMDHQA